MDPQVFYAARNGNIREIERLYTEKPQHLREVTHEKSNVLHIAARKGHSDFVEWVRHHVDEEYSSMCVAQNSYFNTPLHEAAHAGDAGLVRIFISFFENVGKQSDDKTNSVNIFGKTPLLIACMYGHEEAASALLKKSTPAILRYELLLHPAAYGRSLVMALLENSTPPILRYQPCLHAAAYGGHLGVVRLLLNKNNMERFGKVWMMQDEEGATPLHAAIYGGYIDIVREILNPDLGSDWRNWLMKTKDSHGRCAIHAAVVKGKDDIIDYLMTSVPDCIEIRSRDSKTVLHFAVAYGRFDVVKKLICADGWLNYCQDDSGNTALDLAADTAQDLQFVEYLLSFPGVNVNAENKERLTALDIARAEASKIFANENISIHGKDRAEDSRNSINEIISILEEKGASGSYRQEFMKVKGSLSLQKGAKENEVMNVETLVASLVATVTFAAIFQVPGGIQDDENSIQYQAATLAFHSSFSYFLFFDTLALFTSLFVVIAWILCKRLQGGSAKYKAVFMSLTAPLLGISIVSTAIAFVNATSLVTIPPNVKGLRTTNKEAFHKYQTLILLVFFASTTPVTFMMYLYLFMREGAEVGILNIWAQLWSRVKLPFSLFEVLVFMCYFFMGFQLYQSIVSLT